MKKYVYLLFVFCLFQTIYSNVQAQSCVGTATFNVTINNTPTATVTPSTSASYCTGGGVFLTTNQVSGYTYQWLLNGSPISGATSWSYLASSAGSYSVQVSNAGGCAVTSATTAVANTSTNCGVVAQVRVFLQGPALGTSTMTTEMRTDGLLPIAQPFNTTPWNYTGTESVPRPQDIPSNVVDWVLVELRDAANSNTVVARRAAFVLNNGNLRDIDGTNGVRFPGAAAGSYYVVVRGRNHLAVISNATVALPNATQLDLTSPANVLGGTQQLALITSSLYGMKAGDANANGVITVADFNIYQTQSGINIYLNSDFTLDGNITVLDFNNYQPNSSAIAPSQVRY